MSYALVYEFLFIGLAFTVAGLVIGFLAAPYVSSRPLAWLWLRLGKVPTATVLASGVGLLLGLVVASLLFPPLSQLPGVAGVVVPIVTSIVLGWLGAAITVSRGQELLGTLPQGKRLLSGGQSGGLILMDTSAIIDGRIADLAETGFLRGTLAVPQFVLDELRHIADSNDPLRRNRGRRGLEVLGRLRRESSVAFQVLEAGGHDGSEVDARLVRLGKELKAPILTTDFNLNRVAELQGVKVLNINELANALKPAVLPGEEMSVRVLQEGKEPGQGVGFLDDGTMVVVDGGKRYINTHLDVVVTRVLQTAAGRIIFAQPKVTN